MINPCFRCETRKVGCHSSCKMYNEWVVYNEEEKKRRKMKGAYEEYHIKNHKKKY